MTDFRLVEFMRDQQINLSETINFMLEMVEGFIEIEENSGGKKVETVMHRLDLQSLANIIKGQRERLDSMLSEEIEEMYKKHRETLAANRIEYEGEY